LTKNGDRKNGGKSQERTPKKEEKRRDTIFLSGGGYRTVLKTRPKDKEFPREKEAKSVSNEVKGKALAKR